MLVTVEQAASNALAAWIAAHPIFGASVGPVIPSNAAGPVVTAAGAPTEDAFLVVQIVATGALGFATSKYSTNGGRDWSITAPLASTLTVLGVTLTFPVGTYIAGDTYTIASQEALAGLSVEPSWPDPQKSLASRAITITRIGARRDLSVYSDDDVECLGKIADIDSKNALYAWSARACAQTFQVDIWATDRFKRDDLKARLDVVLNGGTSPTGALNACPVGGSLLVPLSPVDGWGNSNADFIFGETEDTDSPETTATSEYRATIKGEGWFNLTVNAASPKLARVLIAMRLRDMSLADQETSNVPRGSAQVDSTGLKITTV